MIKRNGSGIKKTLEKLKYLNSKAVEFGVLAPEASTVTSSNGGDPITMGHLAHIMDEGRTFQNPHLTVIKRGDKKGVISKGKWIVIPPRPFFTNAVNKKKLKVTEGLDGSLIKMFNGRAKPDDVLKKAGKDMVKAIKSEIETGVFDGLSELTVLLKGHSKPLIDSGKLLNSITYKIVNK